MPSFSDIAKALVNPSYYTHPYDIGLQYLNLHIEPHYQILRDGGEIVYLPYAGTPLGFFLNILYRQSPENFTTNFKDFVSIAYPSWHDKPSTEITIQLELWVITETERARLRMIEAQYEQAIRRAIDTLN
jgi:hypothetical protein